MKPVYAPDHTSPTARREQLLFHTRGSLQDPETHGDRESWVHPQLPGRAQGRVDLEGPSSRGLGG